MNHVLRRVFSALVLIGALVLGSTGAAAAGPDPGGASTPAEVSARLALSCPAGSVCAWPHTNGGTSQRCSWSNSDDNWYAQPVVCSWADDQAVKALYNNGQNSAYSGVCFYLSAGYQNFWVWLEQRGGQYVENAGVFIQSHRWNSWPDGC
ncbi:peptidase inhibitor family I36 protein [Actinoplanes sp. NPDC051470]|uniref:peptidase inhibitor family I36 protein n=1 Tax=Actinoplanes sp. NPDC051470 TaxID=3157224 RepID=UPI003447C1EC